MHRAPNRAAYRVLWLLSTRLGTLLLCGPACITGKVPFVQRFEDLPPQRIERILRSWLTNWIRPKRNLARILKAVCVGTLVGQAGAPCTLMRLLCRLLGCNITLWPKALCSPFMPTPTTPDPDRGPGLVSLAIYPRSYCRVLSAHRVTLCTS
jgi:hypothetical protein